MLKIFCPDFRFDSIASIPVEWLKKQQVESWAVKPMPWGFKRALKRFGRQQGKVLVIGDQLLTDVLGAKRMGFTVLWVRSLQGKEFPMTRITRQIEKMLVRRLDAQGLLPEERK